MRAPSPCAWTHLPKHESLRSIKNKSEDHSWGLLDIGTHQPSSSSLKSIEIISTGMRRLRPKRQLRWGLELPQRAFVLGTTEKWGICLCHSPSNVFLILAFPWYTFSFGSKMNNCIALRYWEKNLPILNKQWPRFYAGYFRIQWSKKAALQSSIFTCWYARMNSGTPIAPSFLLQRRPGRWMKQKKWDC